jgi:hypothetical protein
MASVKAVSATGMLGEAQPVAFYLGIQAVDDVLEVMSDVNKVIEEHADLGDETLSVYNHSLVPLSKEAREVLEEKGVKAADEVALADLIKRVEGSQLKVVDLHEFYEREEPKGEEVMADVKVIMGTTGTGDWLYMGIRVVEDNTSSIAMSAAFKYGDTVDTGKFLPIGIQLLDLPAEVDHILDIKGTKAANEAFRMSIEDSLAAAGLSKRVIDITSYFDEVAESEK